jgi:hypothetical protein
MRAHGRQRQLMNSHIEMAVKGPSQRQAVCEFATELCLLDSPRGARALHHGKQWRHFRVEHQPQPQHALIADSPDLESAGCINPGDEGNKAGGGKEDVPHSVPGLAKYFAESQRNVLAMGQQSFTIRAG